MTVAELIEILSALPPDTEVLIPDPGCGCCSSIDGYEEVSHATMGLDGKVALE